MLSGKFRALHVEQWPTKGLGLLIIFGWVHVLLRTQVSHPTKNERTISKQ